MDVADLDTIADVVADFHARISPEEFRARQFLCRQVWQMYLEPSAFYATLAAGLETALSGQATEAPQ